jgi:drug/metabolite transporter (DMT)-like permease
VIAVLVWLRPPAAWTPAYGCDVAFAVTLGAAGVVSVLSALYPIATVVLARIVLGERLDRVKRAGGVAALAGAALVAAG